MMRRKNTLALLLIGVIVLSMNAISASAEENTKQGQAGIDFEEGDTVINPGPDPELPDIKGGDIYFGRQKLSAETEIYNSFNNGEVNDERKYAGFIVKAGNTNGWVVTTEISGFELNNKNTMKNFELELIPGNVETTAGNTGLEPKAEAVKLIGGEGNSNFGGSKKIFSAEKGEGLGKWGCNWQGDLTVVGGSVSEAGTASAIMLWTLNPDVSI